MAQPPAAQVLDINPGAGDSYSFDITNVTGTVLFNANDGVNGFELWSSDGTPGGTAMVLDKRNPG